MPQSNALWAQSADSPASNTGQGSSTIGGERTARRRGGRNRTQKWKAICPPLRAVRVTRGGQRTPCRSTPRSELVILLEAALQRAGVQPPTDGMIIPALDKLRLRPDPARLSGQKNGKGAHLSTK